ncbi:MAG: GNAT family N-acetyltransferase [Hyphomicrobiaceae bacterium]|nr:GNAT family N-acetyltransferase [Hyphomicrobiaceae bacterium]
MTAAVSETPQIEALSTLAMRRGVSPSYHCEVMHGVEAVLAGLDALATDPCVMHRQSGSSCAPTAFQSLAWLKALLAVVATARHAEPRLLVFTEQETERFAIALPMLVRSQGGLRIAEIADLGLSDYCAPWLGPAAPVDATGSARLYDALAVALADVDLIRLEKMPPHIAGHANPMVLHARAVPSRFSRNALIIEDTVEAFLASRGKKYRKEAERARRRLEDMGEVRLARAATREEIDAAYRQLERWQAERHREAGHDYVLDQPEISRFYRALLHDTSSTGAASLFTLTAGGEPVAMLFGVTTGSTFTLIRIADGGERWRQVSPGRMIVLEAVRTLLAQGVREFDMGVGDYPFKRWIGCQSTPLVEVAVPLTWRARPRIAAEAARRGLRANRYLRAFVRRIRALRRPKGAVQ